MSEAGQGISFNAGFDTHGVGIGHHFGGRVYAKETIIPAGLRLTQHIHSFDHLSILAVGTVTVENTTYIGPTAIMIRAGIPHEVIALTDSVWFCIHVTDETDPEKIDHELTK